MDVEFVKEKGKGKEIELLNPLLSHETKKEDFFGDKIPSFTGHFPNPIRKTEILACTLLYFHTVNLSFSFSFTKSRSKHDLFAKRSFSNCHVIAIGDYLISWWAKARS